MIDTTTARRWMHRAAMARRTALSLFLVAGLATAAFARSAPEALPDVAFSDLPSEAQEVYALIGKGGPFRYSRDGVAFGNREKLLQAKPRGYYREYTVPTPGVRARGARRLVCGGLPTAPDACYYSDDHYRSFRRIRK